MSANVTVSGNLANDPELRFTKDGKAVVSFTVMTSKSKKNDAGDWESTDVTAWRVSAWDKLAEHIAESIFKGSPVVVTGNAVWKSWENKDGVKGGAMEITAYDVAVSLKRNPVTISKSAGRDTSSNSVANDPWASPANASDEVPF